MFLAREEEKQKLDQSIKANKNTFIFSKPYQGKTSLLKEVVTTLDANKYLFVYIDCKHTFTTKRFLETCTETIIKALTVSVKDITTVSQKYLPQLSPNINIIPGKGMQITMNYSITPKILSQFIKDFFLALENISKDTKKQVIIAFDDFQELYNIDKAAIIKLIKETINNKYTYIFSCADENLVSKIFNAKDNLLFKIETMIYLNKLPLNVIYFFINQELQKHNLKTTEQVIDKMISICRGEIYFSELLVEATIIYGQIHHRISLMDLPKIIKQLLRNQNKLYQMIFASCSTHQKNLLLAIVKNDGKQVYKSSFIFENDLGSAPSVQTSVAALISKSILAKEDNVHILIDPFFEQWIRINYLQ